MQHGFIDTAGRKINGWAIDLNQVEHRCLLDVYIDQRLVLTFIAGNIIRRDAAAFIESTNETCGFSLDISSMLTRESSEVEIRFNSSGQILPGQNPFIARAPVSKLDIFEGVDGYLFYSGDRNAVVEQMLGKSAPRDDDAQNWADRLCLTQAATTQAGGQFVFGVVPDKIAVLPELLSVDAILSEDRTVTRVVRRTLRLYGIDIVYPLKNLRDVPDPRVWLSRNDSHLNMRAQYFMFCQVCARVGMDPGPMPIWILKPVVLDLVTYNGTDVAELIEIPVFALDESDHIRAMRTRGSDALVYINPGAQIPLIFISGRSSCNMVATFFKEIAQVTVVLSEDRIDVDLIEKFKPALVMQYYTERNLYGGTADLLRSTNPIEVQLISRALELVRRINVSPVDPWVRSEFAALEWAPKALHVTGRLAHGASGADK